MQPKTPDYRFNKAQVAIDNTTVVGNHNLVRLLFPTLSTIYYNICWILIIVSTTDCMLMAIISITNGNCK